MTPSFMRETDDCLRACLETVFECRDIPHFVRTYDEGWYDSLRHWLDRRGVAVVMIAGGMVTPPGPYVVIGQSPRHEGKVSHAVVYADRKLIHDPYPGGGGVLDTDIVLTFVITDIEKLILWKTT